MDIKEEFSIRPVPKKIKFLLVMFAPYRTVQMQIAALSAFLKECGCEVSYLELIIFSGDTLEKFKAAIKTAVLKSQPDLVGFSSYDMNYHLIVEAARYIKGIRPDTKIIVGGHNATLAPDDYMQIDAVDYVCLGEGEPVLNDLLCAMSLGGDMETIKGLYFRRSDKKIIRNPARNLVEDLDVLPNLDRMIVDAQQREIDYLPMFVGKGCPYSCTYCANNDMKNIYPNQNKYVRYRSPENIINEIMECKKNYEFKYVYFYDDIFAFDYKWLEKFGELYRASFRDMPFHCLLRPEIATNEKCLKLLHDAGCNAISMGVESGSEKFRRLILGRKMTNETMIKAAKAIKKYGMELYAFMMVGLPGETFFDMLQSLWLNFKIGAKGVQTGIYYPIKKTALYRYCVEHNLIDEEKRKKIFVYTYDTCLRCTRLRRVLIIVFKWLNSATPIIRRFQIQLFRNYLRVQYKKIVKKSIDYR